jgi:hypothetical protein
LAEARAAHDPLPERDCTGKEDLAGNVVAKSDRVGYPKKQTQCRNSERRAGAEEVALGLLRDERNTYREAFEGFKLTRFDGRVVEI